MNSETIDPETGEVTQKRVHHRVSLQTYKLMETKRELFRRKLSPEERRSAADAATSFEVARDDAHAKGKADAKWVETALYSTDAMTRLERELEVTARKRLAAGEAAIAEVHRTVELRAAANGFRWEEVETHEYADDLEMEMFVVRMDSLEEVSRRRMYEHEIKKAEERRQQNLFGERQ